MFRQLRAMFRLFRACFAPVSSKEFLDIQATIECGFTLKRVRDMIRTFSPIHRTDKFSQHSSIIWPVWLNGWVFVYELGGCGFESSCSHLNFRFRACFEQGVFWHSGNYRVWIHSETRTDMIRTYSQMHRTDKFSQHSSIIWPVWLNGWVFVYELGGCGFESSCSHLNFRFRACFEQGVFWHSGNYRVWIHSETRTDMIRTYSQMHRTDKFSQHNSMIWPVWLNGWVFVYELHGCGF